MDIQQIPYDFSICKVADFSRIPFEDEFLFIGKTDDEYSVVCSTAHVPENAVARDDGWNAFRVCGVLDFSQTGVLAGISALLADEGISIFAVSTYNTDYILVKQDQYQKALQVLAGAGYHVR